MGNEKTIIAGRVAKSVIKAFKKLGPVEEVVNVFEESPNVLLDACRKTGIVLYGPRFSGSWAAMEAKEVYNTFLDLQERIEVGYTTLRDERSRRRR